MKIEKIELKDDIYYVSIKPEWLEKLFGYKSKVRRFKATKEFFTSTGNKVYRDSEGEILYNGHWIALEIDAYRFKF